MDIAMIGTGNVGIVAGTCFAERGNNVICVDIGIGKAKDLRDRGSALVEPGLFDLIIKNFKEGRLSFTTDVGRAVKGSYIVFIAFNLQINERSKVANGIDGVFQSIGKSLDGYKIIITASADRAGTTTLIRETIGRYTDVEFDVAAVPEFLKGGSALRDFTNHHTVKIGTDKRSVATIIKFLYSPFIESENGFMFDSIDAPEPAINYAEVRYLKAKSNGELSGGPF